MYRLKLKERLFILALAVALATVADAHQTTTVGRLQLDSPDLGHTGGTALHTHLRDLDTKISNNVSSRYQEYTGVANGAVTTYTHNFGVPFAELTVVLWSGTGSSKTRINDPAGAGWTIAAGGTPATQVDITAPGSGGPHNFSVELYSGIETLPTAGEAADELLSTNAAGTYSWIKVFNANVDASAAISRSKLASGTANHVVVNDVSGVLSSEAQLAISRGGTGQGTQTAAFDALAPTTTKGDLIAHNGTDNVRRAVGTDGFALIADSAQATGLNWASVLTNPLLDGFMIDGTADEVQLTVQGHSTQTANTLVVETSVGSDLFTVDNNGIVTASSVFQAAGGAVGTPSFGFSGAGNTDNGMYRSATDEIAFATAGTQRLKLEADGDAVFGGGATGDAHIAASPSVTEPNYSFTGDTNTGIWSSGADKLTVVTGGVKAADFNGGNAALYGTSTTGLNSSWIGYSSDLVSWRWMLGKVSNGFADGTKLVVATADATDLQLGTNNAARFTVSSSGQMLSHTGGATSPNYSFSGDENTGIYSSGSEEVAITTNGTADVRFSGDMFSIKTGFTIRTSTSDGSDNDNIAIGGGGDSTQTRGAFIQMFGNQVGSSNGGKLIVSAGNSTEGDNAAIVMRTGGGSDRLIIDEEGDVTIDETDGGGNVPHGCTRRVSAATGVDTQSLNCNAGERLFGGGCDQSSSLALYDNYPTDDDTWICRWNGTPTSGVAIGICCVY